MSSPTTRTNEATAGEIPPFRYNAALANEIELHWQARWEAEHTFWAPNPVGPLRGEGPDGVGGKPKKFVLDMFPYPSGDGLHVGHPLGYIGTDCVARYNRMQGFNVLHSMGFDAFGLPAEQYAIQTGTHPRERTEANVTNIRSQLRRLGLGYDWRRSVSTTDVEYYRWTQWIFLQIFNAWFDPAINKARRISELVAEFETSARATPSGKPWSELNDVEQRKVVDSYRLAYIDEVPVNWCPGLGTVLANEEVTSEGRSERGNFPVYKRPLKQWMMRITAYAERLLDDLDLLDWSDAIKTMQRNWIGRSEGARILFPIDGRPGADKIDVFTTRPDTLFGATFMVLAPEHPLVDAVSAVQWPEGTRPAWTGGHATPPEAIGAYRAAAGAKSDVERQAESREKTGVFIGAYAINPVNGARIPIFIADYVLMGYGTGAIMAVPGQDERDWEFAEKFDLPIIRTVEPTADFEGKAYLGDGPAINSGFLNGLLIADAKRSIIEWLSSHGAGWGTINYKLRDWLFSRQRYWGEPFPIVYDETGLPIALPENLLPVQLPDLDDWTPETSDDAESSVPAPPLSRAKDWVEVTLDLGDGRGPRRFRRELNTMPQWAGSCWYELRYIDPTNDDWFVDPANEAYWMGPRRNGDPGGVDLYVGGVEHAVLHLLYARFWHKVLFDLGYVSSLEPFHRLFNQGYILAAAFKDARGIYVTSRDVEERDGRYFHNGEEVTRELGKMGKSLRNSVTPDEMFEEYGADTLRVYEMSMGPMDASRPWETRAVVGSQRFLQRLWRCLIDETTGADRVSNDEADPETRQVLHRTIAAVTSDMDGMRFNTAIAKLIELTNHLVATHGSGALPREVAEPLVLMVAPLAPHIAEEMWSRIGHQSSLTYERWPVADPAFLVVDQVEIPVQVNGKVRGHLKVSPDAPEAEVDSIARADARIAGHLEGKTVRKTVYVPGRMLSYVVS